MSATTVFITRCCMASPKAVKLSPGAGVDGLVVPTPIFALAPPPMWAAMNAATLLNIGSVTLTRGGSGRGGNREVDSNARRASEVTASAARRAASNAHARTRRPPAMPVKRS